MSEDAAAQRLILDLPSDLEVLAVVRAAAGLFCSRVVRHEPLRARLELPLVEAVTNAIVHANGGDPTRRVRVRLWWRPPLAVAEVEDEGEPFALPPDTGDPPPDAEHGRGIVLMRRLTDRLELAPLPRGNRLVLTWNVP